MLHMEPDYQRGIRPDYSLSVEDVYKDLMVCHIQNSENIELFQYISVVETFPTSWVLELGNTDLPRFPFPAIFGASGNSRHEIVYSEANEDLCVRGVHVGIISRVGESVPNAASIAKILDICRRWEPPDLHDTKYVDGRSLFDAFLKTILCGAVDENVKGGELPNLESLRQAYLLCLRERLVDESTNQLCWLLEAFTPGRAFFSTTDGRIGLCLPSAQAGDYIIAALGHKNALALRPIAESSGRFRLKGECFVHGVMQNDAFLGQLSELGCTQYPWRLEYQSDDLLAVYQ